MKIIILFMFCTSGCSCSMFNGYELWVEILHVFNGKSNDKTRNLNICYNLKKFICLDSSSYISDLYRNLFKLLICCDKCSVVCNFKFFLWSTFDANRQVFEILSFRSIYTYKNVSDLFTCTRSVSHKSKYICFTTIEMFVVLKVLAPICSFSHSELAHF